MVVQSADGAVYSSYRQAIAYAINPNANYIFTQYKKKKNSLILGQSQYFLALILLKGFSALRVVLN